MNTYLKFSISLLVFLIIPITTPLAQDDNTNNDPTDEELAEMDKTRANILMPLAVDKAVEAGARKDHVEKISKELLEGKVEGDDFSETMRHAPVISQTMENEENSNDVDPNLSQFIEQKKSEGLRGRDLANAIHSELNRHGIPAGKTNKNDREVSPLDEDFVPPGQRKKMNGTQNQKSNGTGMHNSKPQDKRQTKENKTEIKTQSERDQNQRDRNSKDQYDGTTKEKPQTSNHRKGKR